MSAHSQPPENPGVATAPRLTNATHILFEVSDMAASVAFYRDALGMALKSTSPKWSEFDLGGVALCLQPLGNGASVVRCNTEIVFSVDDADAAVALFKSRGVRFDVEPTPICSSEGKAYRWARLRDPDGHAIGFYSMAVV